MALAQCPRSGGSIPSGGSFLRDAAPARRYAPPCAIPAMIAPSLALSYFHAPDRAVPRHNSPATPLASPRRANPSCGRSPPYFNRLRPIKTSRRRRGGGVRIKHTTTQKRATTSTAKIAVRRRPDDDETRARTTASTADQRDARAQEKGRQPHARSRVAISAWATNKHRPAVAAAWAASASSIIVRRAPSSPARRSATSRFIGGRLFSVAARHHSENSAGAASIKFGICLTCQYENKPTPQPLDWAARRRNELHQFYESATNPSRRAAVVPMPIS